MDDTTRLSVKIRREGYDGVNTVEQTMTVAELKRSMMATHSDSTCADILAELDRAGIACAVKPFLSTITVRKEDATNE